MTEDTSAQTEQQEDQEAQADLAQAAAAEQQPSEETDWKAKYNEVLNESRKHERRARESAAKIQEFEDRDKTEQQKLEERAQQAEQRAVELETTATRAEVAAEKGLTNKQARRLQGSTREELEADADELLAEFPPSRSSTPDLKQGQRGNQDKQRQVTRGELANMSNSEINQARREGRLDDVLAGRDK